MFPLILSINLVNLLNITVISSLIIYFYYIEVVSFDLYENLTFLKPKYHFLPVNIEKYREDRLEYLQLLIKEYNNLYQTSILLVENESDSDDSADESVDKLVDNTVNEVVDKSVDKSVDNTVDETIDNTVDKSVNETIDNTVDDTVDDKTDSDMDISDDDLVDLVNKKKIITYNLEDY
jgi:hypothetical protein